MRESPQGPGKEASSLKLDEVVLTAAALPDEERQDYLRRVADSQPDLAELALRRLAEAETLPDSFLAVSGADRLGFPRQPSGQPASGAALPPEERYQLGECLGRGGMGRVVAAFDRQLGRPVALKFLTHEDPSVLRLFLREARAQARVRHPHVLDIYSSGELDGQPFISMRYAAGGTLAEAADGLSLEQRIRLLAQVAEGLHAAHREGLLHRDVKPSNVLLEETSDGDLQALVSDFGLATDLDDLNSESADAMAGSPHYIAPERLDGSAPADRRSDIYSLGVTLYELFTGVMPFQGENTLAVLRKSAGAESPLNPRQHNPGLPAELEAVILRCMDRDPSRRYASARAVAADLRRYLEGEVVEAYAAGLAYRMTRFVLRNKLLAAMGTVAVVALLVSSVAVAVFALRADAARLQAELRRGQAEELISFMAVDLYDKLKSLGRLDVLDEVGQAAAEYFSAVPEEALSEEEMLRRSRTLYQIGDVRIQQGDLKGALAPMQQSLALAQRLADLRPQDGERLFELGQSHFWVGYAHWKAGDVGAARKPFEAYLDISRRLVDKDAANRVWLRELSYAHSNLGSLLESEGDLEGALEQFLRTLEIDQGLARSAPDDVDARFELAATHNLVGVVQQALGRLEEAGRNLSEEIRIRRELLEDDPLDPRIREFFATSLTHLGILRSMQGSWNQALGHFEEARVILSALTMHDPSNVLWRFKLAWGHLNLARTAYAQGEWSAAEAALLHQDRIIGELLQGDQRHDWRRTQAVGFYYSALVRIAQDRPASELLTSAVEILEDLAVSRPSDHSVHRWLSQSHLVLGALADTQAARRKALIRAEEVIGPFAEGSRDGRLLAPWAAALLCLDRSEEAQPVLTALDSLGYSEPGLFDFCQAHDGSPSKASASPVSSGGRPSR